jgi:dipeptidyl aminopeptidase/acylaminoacyl peptidase
MSKNISETRNTANTQFNFNSKNGALGWTLAAGTITLFGSATLGISNYLVSKLVEQTKPLPLENYTFTPYELETPYEDVTFPTAKGRMLHGWFLPQPVQERRVIVTAHGHRGRKEDLLGISTFLWKAGFNVLMFDFRAHGAQRVKGDLMSLGSYELEDFQAANEYIHRRFAEEERGEPIVGAFGGSLGAAVALVAAARDERIKAIWADSSFTSRRDVVAANWKNMTHLPDRPIIDTANWFFTRRTGHPLHNFSPLKEISSMKPRPIYFLHGASDSITPISHAYTLYNAATGPKELWVEEGVDHCGIYFLNRTEYRKQAIEFFQKWLVE